MDITNLLIIIVGDYFLLNQNYRMLLTLMIPWLLSKMSTLELGFLNSYFYSNDKKYHFEIKNGSYVLLYEQLSVFLCDYFNENKISNLQTSGPKEYYLINDVEYNIQYKNINLIVIKARKKYDNLDSYYCYFKVWCSDLIVMYDFMDYLKTYKQQIKSVREKDCMSIYHVSEKGQRYINKLNTLVNYSPILDKSILTSLYKDIDTFISSKQKYLDNQKSYKRTYLFEGLPGTGKTSLIKYLAIKYKRDIEYIQIDTFTSGINFFNAMINSISKSIIVLEDFACKEDNDSKEKKPVISKKDMINVLDGLMCPFNDHIIIITTNHIENIDPVLIRPGRIDYRINFTYATREQIQQIIDYNKLEVPEKIINKYIGKATIAEIIQKIETNTFV